MAGPQPLNLQGTNELSSKHNFNSKGFWAFLSNSIMSMWKLFVGSVSDGGELGVVWGNNYLKVVQLRLKRESDPILNFYFALFTTVPNMKQQNISAKVSAILSLPLWLLVGRGDNLQLFISPLLKYEEWLYNIIDDKNFAINSLEPHCTGEGVWRFHIPP